MIHPIATLQLIEITPRQKILAGHHADDDSVFVLRKSDAGEWFLFSIPVDESRATLRSFIEPDDAEAMERTAAILATMDKPKRRRKSRKTK